MGGACCGCWKKEFAKRNLGLEWRQPQTFCYPQFGRLIIPYFVYRLIMTALFLYVAVNWGLHLEFKAKYFVYLTNWSLVLLVFNNALQMICVGHQLYLQSSRKDSYQDQMPVLYKITWVVNNIVIVAAPLVSLVYNIATASVGFDTDIDDKSAHVFNTVYILVDMAISGVPIRVYHWLHFLPYGVIYVVFMITYQVYGGIGAFNEAALYDPLDWTNAPAFSVGGVIALFVISFIIHICLYGIYRLRVFLYDQCSCSIMYVDEENDESTVRPSAPFNKVAPYVLSDNEAEEA